VLELIDSTLESFFRATVPLSAQDVDVSFEPPDREWSAKLTRPTVNVFLFDIRRSTARAKAGIGRRGKKVYAVTEAGRDRMRELLTAPGPDDERSFSIRVAFCQQLAPAQRLALFERRKAELTAMLDTRRSTLAGTGARRADPYRRLLRDRDTRSLTSDLIWIDELVAATAESLSSGVVRDVAFERTGTTDTATAVIAPPTLPRPPFSGSIIDPSPKAGSQP